MEQLRTKASEPPPDIAALAERFTEPLRGEIAESQSAIPEPAVPVPTVPEPAVIPRAESAPEPRAVTPPLPRLPKPPAQLRLSKNTLVSVLAVLTLVSVAVLVVQLWQDLVRPHSDSVVPLTEALGAKETVYAKKDTARLQAEASAGHETAPSTANDVTGSLPHGPPGWSIAPDVATALPFSVPVQTGTFEPSDTGIAPSPAEPETVAEAEHPSLTAAATAPPPKPATPAEAEAPVRTVKVVPIKPPADKKPYDGAYALGAPAEEPEAPGEWMVTKTAVDMHAKAQQSSETVKVAQGGIKVRVTDRHRNWIQVHDPKSSTTGWIYDRFLKPAAAPAQ